MKRMLVIIMLLAMILLTACVADRPSTEIDVRMTDFAFTPSRFTVTAGEQITLNAMHEGLVEHDFVIMKLSADVGGHFTEEDLENVYWLVKIQPGESQTVSFTAPSGPGTYQIVCGMAGHVEAGMVGQLEVTAP